MYHFDVQEIPITTGNQICRNRGSHRIQYPLSSSVVIQRSSAGMQMKKLISTFLISAITLIYRPHDFYVRSFQQRPQLHTVSHNARGSLSRPQYSSSSSSLSTDIKHSWKLHASETRLYASVHPSQGLNQQRRTGHDDKVYGQQQTKKRELRTLLRVGLPSIFAGVLAYSIFPFLAMTLASLFTNSAGALTVLSTDSSQFVQNFLSVSSLLFSILVGQTYYFLYTQQESIYYALFHEVTEAKSLLEQVALVCQGRSMYPRCLQSMVNYVENDLKQIRKNPAILLSARPVDDPLESIMYMTSVGVPSTVYETVKSLREARARRLGALQRKLPAIHMALLWTLAAIELVSFPLLGAGTQTIGGYNVLTVEGILFGVMTSGIVLTLRVVGELWRPAGGAYNVDNVLSVMVSGLENELQSRLAGRTVSKIHSSNMAPSGARE